MCFPRESELTKLGSRLKRTCYKWNITHIRRPCSTFDAHCYVGCIMYEVAVTRDWRLWFRGAGSAQRLTTPAGIRGITSLTAINETFVQSTSAGPLTRHTRPTGTACLANFRCLFIAEQMMTVAGAEQSIIHRDDDDDHDGLKRSWSNWIMFYWWLHCATSLRRTAECYCFMTYCGIYTTANDVQSLISGLHRPLSSVKELLVKYKKILWLANQFHV